MESLNYIAMFILAGAVVCGMAALLIHDGASRSPPSGMPAQAIAELDNATRTGFNVSPSTFEAASSGQCYLQQIAECNNNEPGQFICANSDYESQLSSQYQSIYSNSMVACPMFFMAGSLPCAVQNGYCVVSVDRDSSP